MIQANTAAAAGSGGRSRRWEGPRPTVGHCCSWRLAAESSSSSRLLSSSRTLGRRSLSSLMSCHLKAINEDDEDDNESNSRNPNACLDSSTSSSSSLPKQEQEEEPVEEDDKDLLLQQQQLLLLTLSPAVPQALQLVVQWNIPSLIMAARHDESCRGGCTVVQLMNQIVQRQYQQRLQSQQQQQPPQSKSGDSDDDDIHGNPVDITVPDHDALLLSMRILARVGVFVEQEQKQSKVTDDDDDDIDECTFALTPLGQRLAVTTKTTARSSSSSSLESMVKYCLDAPLWNAWGSSTVAWQQQHNTSTCYNRASSSSSSSATATTAFALGNNHTSSAEYYGKHATSLRHANEFVRLISDQEVQACVNHVDWVHLLTTTTTSTTSPNNSSISNHNNHNIPVTVVDLGGYSGQVLEAVAARYPNLLQGAARFLCLDLPHVIEAQTRDSSNNHPTTTSSPIQRVGGDMFDPNTIPQPCHVIFMKHILLCDWDEEASRRILASCHESLSDGGRLIVGEAVLPEPGSVGSSRSSRTTISDDLLDLFSRLDGRSPSRTKKEWERFADPMGFHLEKLVRTAIPTCSILIFRKK